MTHPPDPGSPSGPQAPDTRPAGSRPAVPRPPAPDVVAERETAAALEPAAPVLRRGPEPRAGGAWRWLWRFFLGVLLLAGFLGAGAAGYWLRDATPVPVWDPLFFRVLQRDPLDTSLPGPGPWVTGYFVHYDPASLDTLRVRAPDVDQVVAFSYGIGGEGQISGRDPDVLLGLMYPEKLVLLFANMVDDDFSVAAVRKLLQDRVAQARAIDGIIEKVERLNAAGAQIDFEAVPNELRGELTRFMSDLGRALQQRGRSLSMAVPAKTRDDPSHNWNGAFDYPALAMAVDYLYIMAYDEHYSGGPPGPVASLPWVEQVVRHAVTELPNKKIILGVPGYGYDWGPAGGRAYGSERMAERLHEMGVTATWEPHKAENYATYAAADGTHVVWYPDERSLQAKLELAHIHGLKGVAIWRLGLERPEYWDALTPFRAGLGGATGSVQTGNRAGA